jgi:hypothetical protein
MYGRYELVERALRNSFDQVMRAIGNSLMWSWL